MRAFLRLFIVGVAFANVLAAVASAQEEVFVPPPATHSVGGPFLTTINSTFPGRMWLGYTAVDNGLGFGTGGYFTLGAKTRIGEDYFGGRWLLEGRGHLAHEQGNVFGNAGIERVFTIESAKSDVGVSVWFDADGDRERNFGHTFEQVGVGGYVRNPHFELRANGYIPVNDTGFRIGDPSGSCFFQHFILLQHGLDSALEGFDVELRLRPFSWHMFQGTIDVGGYYYADPDETLTGITSFGGVRVRAGLQTMNGVGLEAELNQDERFDTTAYFRVVVSSAVFGQYDFLGRDLNPTIRNDHVVKVHQDPIFVIDPRTGAPYRVVHVDSSNTSAGGGDGTFENPYTTLTAADGTINPGNSLVNDVILVREGVGPYNEIINLLNGQFLLGDGVAHNLPITGGFFTLCNDQDGNIPDINGVVLGGNNVVRGFNITPLAGATGILANPAVNPIAANGAGNPLLAQGTGGTLIDEVQIDGGGIGVDINGANTGSYLFTDANLQNAVAMSITNTTTTAFNVNGLGAAASLDLDYNGNITSSQGTAINVANLAAGAPATPPELAFSNGLITVTGGNGFVANTVTGSVAVNSSFNQTGGANGIDIQASTGTFTFANATITNPTGIAVSVVGGAPALTYVGSASKNNAGALVNIDGIGNNAGPQPFDIDFQGGILAADGAGTGIRVANVTGGATLRFTNVDIGLTTPLTNDAVTLLNNTGATTTFNALDVVTNGGIGLNWTNGGTVSVAAGTVNSTAALAMNVTGMTAGAGAVNFTSVTANNTAGGGVILQNNAGTWNLGTVAITNTGGTGLAAANAGTLNVNGTISTTTGTALSVTGGTLLTGNFTNLSSSNSATSGINIAGLAGGSSFAVTGGTITGADANSVNIQNGAGAANFTISNLDITFDPAINGLMGIVVSSGDGNVTIANNTVDVNNRTGATGIFVQGNGSLNGFNLGTGISRNNTTANLGVGSVNFNFNLGVNITGDIEVDGVLFFP